MSPTEAAFLDALADCLEAGDTLPEALGKVRLAGRAAERLTEQVLRAGSLRGANVLDEEERSLLPAEDSGAAVAARLRSLALRRRRILSRRRALRWGLVGPFAFAALTVVLDPLPNLVAGEPYFWLVARGLMILAIVAIVVLAGPPALARRPRACATFLRICSAVPGLRWFTALHSEEELVTALAPFAQDDEVRIEGLTAGASLLPWSPLADALRTAARPPPATGMQLQLPLGGLQLLVRELSLPTALAFVGGVASKRLPQRLAERAEAISTLLTLRLRLLVRIGAYALVVAFSVSSLVGMISRGLPGLPTLSASPDQKELEDILKQLGQPSTIPPP